MFNINDIVDTPLGCGRIICGDGRNNYWICLDESKGEAFAELGCEWFGGDEIEMVEKYHNYDQRNLYDGMTDAELAS